MHATGADGKRLFNDLFASGREKYTGHARMPREAERVYTPKIGHLRHDGSDTGDW